MIETSETQIKRIRALLSEAANQLEAVFLTHGVKSPFMEMAHEIDAINRQLNELQERH